MSTSSTKKVATYRVSSLEELKSVVHKFAEELKGGDQVFLIGPLGSGKTTFTQELAKQLGIHDEVTSPTFTIAAEYQVSNHKTIQKLVHLDLYRLEESRIGDEQAVMEILKEASDTTRVTIVEWADRLGSYSPPVYKKIVFEHGAGETERVIKIMS